MVFAGANELTQKSSRVEPGRVIMIHPSESHEHCRNQLRAEETFQVRSREESSVMKHACPREQGSTDVIANVPSDEVIEKNPGKQLGLSVAQAIDVREPVEIDTSIVLNVFTNAFNGAMSLHACDGSLTNETGM